MCVTISRRISLLFFPFLGVQPTTFLGVQPLSEAISEWSYVRLGLQAGKAQRMVAIKG